mgnify:CR=1
MKAWKERLLNPGNDQFRLGYEKGKPIPNMNCITDMQTDINLKVLKLGFAVILFLHNTVLY